MHKGLFLLPVIFFVAMSGFLVSYDAATAPAAVPARIHAEARASAGEPVETARPEAEPPVLLARPELENVSIDLNAASAAELETLPGIGPAKAAAIVEYVRINGPLGRVEDLLEVKGIGEKTLEKIRPYLFVE